MDAADRLVLANELAELGRASDWLAERVQALGLTEDTTFAVRLCVEEALANVVTHAYGEDEERELSLAILPGPGELVLVVEDQGVPFNPLAAEAPPLATSIEDAAIGGRGLTLIKSFTSRLGYERRGDTNILTMGFALPA